MCAGYRYKKTQRPKSLKGARKQVEELKALLVIEEDSMRAICELNDELDALNQKRGADKFEHEYLPQSFIGRLTDTKRETEESKRNY